jgi:hypothetical protein
MSLINGLSTGGLRTFFDWPFFSFYKKKRVYI